jgi:MFS family permease
LITTAFSFSLRAGIIPNLQAEFDLNAEQMGHINSMWFYGFPLAMVIGGLFYHKIGPKLIMQFAFIAHSLGIILTIWAGGFVGLMISTFLIGLGNGCTEAACNPMIADTYSGSKMNKMLNRFHMWFPGGMVLGYLLSLAMGGDGFALPWQWQVWIILVPAVIYAYLFWGQTFPKPKIEGVTSIAENSKAMVNPLFIFIFVLMAITAITEFAPQQWTTLILKESGASPLLITALITGVMAVGRFFAGPIIDKLDQTGVLLGSAVFATIGIYLFSTQTGAMAYVAALFFAVGVCYFWPVMIGFVAQRIPLSGALGMSAVGAMGMFSNGIFNPIIGGWIDKDMAEASQGFDLKGMKDAIAQKLPDFNGTPIEEIEATISKIELSAGQATLSSVLTFPIILIVAFTILYFWQKGKAKGAAAAH